MSWGAKWPLSVLIAKNAIDALSVLSLQLVPATRKGCAVVSAGALSATIPFWIEAWNPRRIFCAYDATLTAMTPRTGYCERTTGSSPSTSPRR